MILLINMRLCVVCFLDVAADVVWLIQSNLRRRVQICIVPCALFSLSWVNQVKLDRLHSWRWDAVALLNLDSVVFPLIERPTTWVVGSELLTAFDALDKVAELCGCLVIVALDFVFECVIQLALLQIECLDELLRFVPLRVENRCWRRSLRVADLGPACSRRHKLLLSCLFLPDQLVDMRYLLLPDVSRLDSSCFARF